MSERSRILITGIGVVAPSGIGKEEFWRSCAGLHSSVGQTTLMTPTDNGTCGTKEIKGLDVGRFLGTKGLRNLDRTTLLALISAKLALDDAGVVAAGRNSDALGVVLGSTTGSVHSISQFDIDGLVGGPRYVNPAVFPNTVINSPASQIAIRFGITGLNATISTGFAASLNALEYACDMVSSGRVSGILVGGVEELCPETAAVFNEFSSPKFGRRNGSPVVTESGTAGYWCGEGGALVFIEPEDMAVARGAEPYAELMSTVSGFSTSGNRWMSSDESVAEVVVRDALRLADIDPGSIDCVSISGALSCKAEGARASMLERRVLDRVIGERLGSIQNLSIRELCGETFSASGMLQLVAALGNRGQTRDTFALVTTLGSVGPCAAAVLRILSVKRPSERSAAVRYQVIGK